MLTLANVEASAPANSFWDGFSQFLQFAIKENSFASGMVLGALLTTFIHWISGRGASKERERRLDLDLQREKELLNQIALKEERLSRLHDEMEKRSKEHQAEIERVGRRK